MRMTQQETYGNNATATKPSNLNCRNQGIRKHSTAHNSKAHKNNKHGTSAARGAQPKQSKPKHEVALCNNCTAASNNR